MKALTSMVQWGVLIAGVAAGRRAIEIDRVARGLEPLRELGAQASRPTSARDRIADDEDPHGRSIPKC